MAEAGGPRPASGGHRQSKGERPPSTPGWREVLAVAAVVVAAVFGAEVVTSALPPAWQDVIFRTPLAIVLLAAGTVGLLAWIARRQAPGAKD